MNIHGYIMKLLMRIDSLVQEKRNSSALAMELRLSYTNQSRYALVGHLCEGKKICKLMPFCFVDVTH